MTKAICSIAVLAVLIETLLVGVPMIGQWEKANGFPFGRMCDANIFNLYQSSCPAR